MEEYSSEEVYSLQITQSCRLLSDCSKRVFFFRSRRLEKQSSLYSCSVQRSSLFSERSREREGLFVFFSNREVFFSLSLSLEYIRSIYSFFLCSLYFFSRQTRESNSESSSSLLTAYVYRVYAAVVAIVVVCLRCKIRRLSLHFSKQSISPRILK